MNDELDRALREQVSAFSGATEGATADLDEVVRRSRARRRTRVAVGSTLLVAVVAIAIVGVAVRPTTTDLATVPDTAPTTTTDSSFGTTAPPDPQPSTVTTGTITSTTTTTTTTDTTATIAPDTTGITSPTTPTADPTCTAPEVGLVITYPMGWFEDRCYRFDPEPQGEPVGADTEWVAVWTNLLEDDLPTAIGRFQTESVDRFVSGEHLRFGAFDAYCFEEVATGRGLVPEGNRIDACMVEFPTGLILFSTMHDPQDPASSHRVEMRWMAERARPIA
jgi:hypothetical protein